MWLTVNWPLAFEMKFVHWFLRSDRICKNKLSPNSWQCKCRWRSLNQKHSWLLSSHGISSSLLVHWISQLDKKNNNLFKRELMESFSSSSVRSSKILLLKNKPTCISLRSQPYAVLKDHIQPAQLACSENKHGAFAMHDGGMFRDVLLLADIWLSRCWAEMRNKQVVLGSDSALRFQSKDLDLQTNRSCKWHNTSVQCHRTPAWSDNTPFVVAARQLLDHIE